MAIENQVSFVFLLFKTVRKEGEGDACLKLWPKGGWCSFGGWGISECGRLFEEVRYLSYGIVESSEYPLQAINLRTMNT